SDVCSSDLGLVRVLEAPQHLIRAACLEDTGLWGRGAVGLEDRGENAGAKALVLALEDHLGLGAVGFGEVVGVVAPAVAVPCEQRSEGRRGGQVPAGLRGGDARQR